MKIVAFSVLASAFIAAFYSFEFKNEKTYSITVGVNNLRNINGVVQFTLYNKENSIPDEKFENYYRIVKNKVVNNSTTATFINLPPGKYAVNILHDENENGQIDKGFLLPIEGIGFSNFQSIGLTNRPNFSKASFELKEDRTINIKVIYM